MLTTRYNKICGNLRSLIHRISLLPAEDPFRQQKEAEMLNKLYDMGILGRFKLSLALLTFQMSAQSHRTLRTRSPSRRLPAAVSLLL